MIAFEMKDNNDKSLVLTESGPFCLYMVIQYYGCDYSLEHIRFNCRAINRGTSLTSLSLVAKHLGFISQIRSINYNNLPQLQRTGRSGPIIWYKSPNRFIVLWKSTNYCTCIADPFVGLYYLQTQTFIKQWMTDHFDQNALIIKPGKKIKRIL